MRPHIAWPNVALRDEWSGQPGGGGRQTHLVPKRICAPAAPISPDMSTGLRP